MKKNFLLCVSLSFFGHYVAAMGQKVASTFIPYLPSMDEKTAKKQKTFIASPSSKQFSYVQHLPKAVTELITEINQDNPDMEKIKLLIKEPAVLNFVTKTSRSRNDFMVASPLVVAIKKGHNNIVRLLLKQKALPDLPDEDGLRPIIHAIDALNREAVIILIEFGAKMNHTPGEVTCPLKRAVCKSISLKDDFLPLLSIVEILVKNEAFVNECLPVVTRVLKRPKVDNHEHPSENGFSPEVHLQPIIFFALGLGPDQEFSDCYERGTIARFLLEQGADLSRITLPPLGSNKRITLVMELAARGYSKMLELIMHTAQASTLALQNTLLASLTDTTSYLNKLPQDVFLMALSNLLAPTFVILPWAAQADLTATTADGHTCLMFAKDAATVNALLSGLSQEAKSILIKQKNATGETALAYHLRHLVERLDKEGIGYEDHCDAAETLIKNHAARIDDFEVFLDNTPTTIDIYLNRIRAALASLVRRKHVIQSINKLSFLFLALQKTQ